MMITQSASLPSWSGTLQKHVQSSDRVQQCSEEPFHNMVSKPQSVERCKAFIELLSQNCFVPLVKMEERSLKCKKYHHSSQSRPDKWQGLMSGLAKVRYFRSQLGRFRLFDNHLNY